MYRILVGIDGSEHADRAAQFAVDLAKRIDGAELQLINVQEPPEESQTHGLARDAIRQHRETLAVATGTTAKAMAAAAGVPCTFEWHFGDPAEVLVNAAHSMKCALIVMGSRGAGAIQNLLLGSAAQKALHLSSVPVTLVK
jgi:nucleotide-binding universal stress UspA family protein